jgi:dCTP deaminase
MGTLSGQQIVELVRSGELVIDPFDEELVEPATYDLRLADVILASPIGPGVQGGPVELRPSYNVKTGQMVSVKSAERLTLPLSIASGSFGIRSHYAKLGFNAFGGVHLDPGFNGVIVMNLQNVGPEPITLIANEPFFTVQFEKLDRPATKGYSGPNQDQYDFPDDLVRFISSAQTTSLAEIPVLRNDIARLSVLLEEIADRLPDPDEGLDVRADIVDLLHRSSKKSHDSLISLDEMRSKMAD